MNVFISYSEHDQGLAERLAEGLRKSGFRVWDESQIFPGENWAERTAQAMQESEAMIVLLTPSSIHSSRVRADISYALGEQKFKGRLIPVVKGSSEEIWSGIPWVFKHNPFQMIQVPNLEQDDQELIQVIQALEAVA